MKIRKSLVGLLLVASVLTVGCQNQQETQGMSREEWLDPKLKETKVDVPAAVNLQVGYQEPKVIDKTMLKPGSVAYDLKNETLYVSDPKSSKVMKWKDGKLSAFLEAGNGDEGVKFPHTVRVDQDSRVWVLDPSQGKVKVYEADGKVYKSFALDETGLVTTMGIDNKGHAFVGYAKTVVQYNLEGKRVRVFEEPVVSSVLAYDNALYFYRNDGEVKVGEQVDQYKAGFLKYTTDGASKQVLPTYQTFSGELVVNPVNNNVYMWDGHKRLVQLDKDGKVVTTYYDFAPANKYDSRLRTSFGLSMAFDQKGNIYTVNKEEGELYQLLVK